MASQIPILYLTGVTRNFGGLQALKDVNLRIEQGDLRGIIGPNGAGKTTLFNVVTGEFKPSSGKVYLRGEDISGLPPYTICRKGLSRTFQLTRIFPEMTVYDSVWAGANSKARHPWNPVSSAHHLEDIEKETVEICKLIGLEEKRDELAVNLSYGDQKVLEIAMALSTKPSLLLLDEPTQGVGGKEVDMIVEVVKKLSEGSNLFSQVDSLDFFVGADLLRCSLGKDPTFGEHRHGFAELHHHVNGVLDEHDGHLF